MRDPEGRLQPHARQRPGNARLAEASLAEEIAAALDATDKDVSIGGAGLAAPAIELGLVDELRMFRNPIVVGGGTPFLPPVTEDIALDLIETRTFGSRVIYERYRPARDALAREAPCKRRNPRNRGFRHGRYWARTSDLRLVEAALSQLS